MPGYEDPAGGISLRHMGSIAPPSLTWIPPLRRLAQRALATSVLSPLSSAL